MTSNGTTSYSYNGTSNRLLGSSGAVTSTLGYDAAGNLLSNASTTNYRYAYDASGRMVTESHRDQYHQLHPQWIWSARYQERLWRTCDCRWQ